jgi:hypothetical protein
MGEFGCVSSIGSCGSISKFGYIGEVSFVCKFGSSGSARSANVAPAAYWSANSTRSANLAQPAIHRQFGSVGGSVCKFGSVSVGNSAA